MRAVPRFEAEICFRASLSLNEGPLPSSVYHNGGAQPAAKALTVLNRRESLLDEAGLQANTEREGVGRSETALVARES